MTQPPNWRKSSHSGPDSNCVEVADQGTGGQIWVRDTKNPTATPLTFTPRQWTTFLTSPDPR